MMQSGPVFKHRAEIYTALVAVTVKLEYKSHNDRKLALELLGDYMPTHKLLAALTAKGSAGVKTEAELDELVKALERSIYRDCDHPTIGNVNGYTDAYHHPNKNPSSIPSRRDTNCNHNPHVCTHVDTKANSDGDCVLYTNSYICLL